MSQGAIPPPDGVTADLEHPKDVIRTINFVTQGLTIAFCSAFVLIRTLHRTRTVGLELSLDDYLTFASWVLMMGYCICNIFLSVYGGGYHMWEVPATDVVPYFKSAYAATIFYAPMTLSIKLSLLSLLARIFAPYKKRVYGLYALAVLLILYYLTAWILKIRVCSPISAYWLGETDKCLDQQALITADSIISTVTDAIILVLPLPLTWSLQIPTSKKLRVGGMLAIGGLATAFSAWRLNLFVTQGKSPDMTILFVQLVMSGNAEAGIALICTCLPALVAQFNVMKSRVGYGSSRNTSHRNNNSGSAGHKLSKMSGSRFSTAKDKHNLDVEASSDEAELVINAQGHSVQDSDSTHFGGIMRKVEVTHTVSYAGHDADKNARTDTP